MTNGIKPLQYGIYKGMTGKFGAIQFSLQAPHYYRGKEKDFTGERALLDGKMSSDWKLREGAIFVEITSATGNNVYNWENKVTVALSVIDMGKVLAFLTTGAEVTLTHDPGAKSETQGAIKKYMKFTSPNGIYGKEGARGGCMVQVNMEAHGERTSHSVPMSTDECLVLRQLLAAAIPVALSWN